MTKSVNLNRYPDADYTPSDIGPPDKPNPVELWDTFEDNEVNRLMEMEEGTPL